MMLVLVALWVMDTAQAAEPSLQDAANMATQPHAETLGLLSGIPTGSLPAQHVSDVEPNESAPGWQAVVPGGWVRLRVLADIPSAEADFSFQRGAATTMRFPLVDVSGADEACGDPEGFLLARKANLVLTVRAPNASALATRLLTAAR